MCIKPGPVVIIAISRNKVGCYHYNTLLEEVTKHGFFLFDVIVWMSADEYFYTWKIKTIGDPNRAAH